MDVLIVIGISLIILILLFVILYVVLRASSLTNIPDGYLPVYMAKADYLAGHEDALRQRAEKVAKQIEEAGIRTQVVESLKVSHTAGSYFLVVVETNNHKAAAEIVKRADPNEG